MGLNIQLIRESFEVAKPIAGEVADKFYELLWGDFPESKALFKGTNMQKQKKALIGSLVFIVENLDRAEDLTKYLKKMGARHVKYGTEPEHYDWVGSTLLKTFAHFFEDNWTDELQAVWAEAYGIIAKTMLEGADELNRSPSENEILQRAHDIASSLLYQAVDEAIDERLIAYIRGEARKVLMQVLEEESRLYIKQKAV